MFPVKAQLVHTIQQPAVEDVQVGLKRLAGGHDRLCHFMKPRPLHADDMPDHDRIVMFQKKPVLVKQGKHLLLLLLGTILLHNHGKGMQNAQHLISLVVGTDLQLEEHCLEFL